MKNNHLKAGMILSYTAICIQSLISLIYTPVLLRLLGSADYGLLQLAISTIANLGILSFGFTGSYMRFCAPYREKGEFNMLSGLNGMFLIIFLAASLLSLIAGTVITLNAELLFTHSMTEAEIADLKRLLAIMTVNIVLTFPLNIFDMHIASQERFTFQKLLVIITAVLNPLITLPLLLCGFGSSAAAVCIVAISAVKLVSSAFYCIKHLNMRFSFNIDRTIFKQISVFSFFIFLNIISDQINWNVDKTILGIFKGSESVTFYSIGSQLNGYFLTFSYALCSLFTPRAHTLVAQGKSNVYLTRFFTRFSRLQLIIMTYVFLMLTAVGKPFIRLWSGLDSDIPYYTAIILISPLLITSAQSIGIEIQRAKDLHKFRSVAYILIAAFNILISIPLCVKFGELGCAAGTCIGLVIGNIIIMNIYYHTRVGLNILYFWRSTLKLLPAFIPTVIAVIIFRHFSQDGIISVISGAAIITLIYVPCIYFLIIRRKRLKAE